jgi:predicted transcriptional regulator
MQTSEQIEIENKVVMMFLLEKMRTPMTFGLIMQFAVENNYMNQYNAQMFLDEMVEAGYVEMLEVTNIAHYVLTDEGETALDSFMGNIPQVLKERVARFVTENRNTAKREFEITANYFYDQYNNEYIVKCVAYEDDIPLIELKLSVVTKEQALVICNNWKNNVESIYGDVLRVLTEKRK